MSFTYSRLEVLGQLKPDYILASIGRRKKKISSGRGHMTKMAMVKTFPYLRLLNQKTDYLEITAFDTQVLPNPSNDDPKSTFDFFSRFTPLCVYERETLNSSFVVNLL